MQESGGGLPQGEPSPDLRGTVIRDPHRRIPRRPGAAAHKKEGDQGTQGLDAVPAGQIRGLILSQGEGEAAIRIPADQLLDRLDGARGTGQLRLHRADPHHGTEVRERQAEHLHALGIRGQLLAERMDEGGHHPDLVEARVQEVQHDLRVAGVGRIEAASEQGDAGRHHRLFFSRKPSTGRARAALSAGNSVASTQRITVVREIMAMFVNWIDTGRRLMMYTSGSSGNE